MNAIRQTIGNRFGGGVALAAVALSFLVSGEQAQAQLYIDVYQSWDDANNTL